MNPQGEQASGTPDKRAAVPTRPCSAGGTVPKDRPVLSPRLRAGFSKEILRKEVIQPQVPLRLPCYDLVPITGFIFGACL